MDFPLPQGPQLLMLVVVVVAFLAVLVIVGLVILGVVLYLVRGRGSANPKARSEMLFDVGYTAFGEGQWSMAVPGTTMVFSELANGGLRWTVQLPRYNTLTLKVEERSHATPGTPGSFQTDIPEIDARFVVSSILAAQTLALVTNHKVTHAMLAMPHLQLELSGDELIIEDLQRHGITTQGGSELEAEAELHRSSAVLVTAMLGTLYSKLTGTLLPEHR